MDLHSCAYGSGSKHTVVISKVPLPRYRSEFDAGSTDSCIGMSNETRQQVHEMLSTMEPVEPVEPVKPSLQGAMQDVQYISSAPMHVGPSQRSFHGSISSRRGLDRGGRVVHLALMNLRDMNFLPSVMLSDTKDRIHPGTTKTSAR
ncbi:unnamed protein product [Ostreobium quekettii]|uniref:Uncharacterized protein n=1 Tax=Ostreobium quekettii TaxID=121088 RepID=A0A8S1IWP6_9CHLO|nr:unnamed protein product [Ostreobium quekettii]